MADFRAAGMPSGTGLLLLDANKPVSGLLRDIVRNDARAPSMERTVPRFVSTGDRRDCEVLPRATQSFHMTGSLPRMVSHQQACIPGYTGHVAGKVAENLHGSTFHIENARAAQGLPLRQMRKTFSGPFHISAPDVARGPRGLEVAPRVPGYMGTIPGKLSETVHGMRTAEANEMSGMLRENNPYVTSDGWLRRGHWPTDRLATYKWVNRFMTMDAQQLFSESQDAEAKEMNERLGTTFGLQASPPNPFKPGDRFVHSKLRPTKDRKTNPVMMSPAGQPSMSAKLDQQRWLLHNAITIGNGNQRPAY